MSCEKDALVANLEVKLASLKAHSLVDNNEIQLMNDNINNLRREQDDLQAALKDEKIALQVWNPTIIAMYCSHHRQPRNYKAGKINSTR